MSKADASDSTQHGGASLWAADSKFRRGIDHYSRTPRATVDHPLVHRKSAPPPVSVDLAGGPESKLRGKRKADRLQSGTNKALERAYKRSRSVPGPPAPVAPASTSKNHTSKSYAGAAPTRRLSAQRVKEAGPVVALEHSEAKPRQRSKAASSSHGPAALGGQASPNEHQADDEAAGSDAPTTEAFSPPVQVWTSVCYSAACTMMICNCFERWPAFVNCEVRASCSCELRRRKPIDCIAQYSWATCRQHGSARPSSGCSCSASLWQPLACRLSGCDSCASKRAILR